MRRCLVILGVIVVAACAAPEPEGINVYAETGLASATAFELRLPDGMLVTVTGDAEVARLAKTLDVELPELSGDHCTDGIGLLFFTADAAIELTYCEADGTLSGDAINSAHVPVPDEFVVRVGDWMARAVPPGS
jgi:hypothetical protein